MERSETLPVAVVVPAYNEADRIAGVLARMPAEVARVIIVDDGSTDGTVEVIRRLGDPRVVLIRHDRNQGVGGAVCSGYRRALELGAGIVVKVDGDGQIDPAGIPRLVAPLRRGAADYAKGARFYRRGDPGRMPKSRLVGNLGLSFLAKMVSGYWNTLDPANGFTAIHRRALERLPLDRLDRGFFFETDMLIHLYYEQAVVTDVPFPSHYGDERSKLRQTKILLTFPGRLVRALARRILWRYFVQDFNACSLFLLAGSILSLAGLGFGVFQWVKSAMAGEVTTAGTVMLAAVPLLVGFQLLLQAAVLDIGNVPRNPISTLPPEGSPGNPAGPERPER